MQWGQQSPRVRVGVVDRVTWDFFKKEGDAAAHAVNKLLLATRGEVYLFVWHRRSKGNYVCDEVPALDLVTELVVVLVD